VIPLNIPPLRERKGDIPALIEHFIRKHSRADQQPFPRMSHDTIQHFLEYDWPGNIRELENMVERWLVLYQGGFLATSHLFLNEGAAALPQASMGRPSMSVREMERALITETLQAMNGNRTQAAKVLGISLRTLRNKLREYQGGFRIGADDE
jgi:DNA-binding NtrC family response regulator